MTAPEHEPAKGAGCRHLIEDKWALRIVSVLGAGPHRFTELKRAIDGISQRMLTVTLRGLERDGLVTRTVHPTIPPRVEYALTPMGRTLLETVCTLLRWADDHLPEIDAARAAYDRRAALLDASLNGDPTPPRQA
jgi:DNA-binding HxlR family transcriptional regulator